MSQNKVTDNLTAEMETNAEDYITVTDISEEDIKEDVQHNLFIHLKSAKNLPPKKNNGTTDAFVKFSLGQKVVHKTKTIPKDLNPAWDDSFLIVVPDLSSNLDIKIYHQNLVKDDLIGTVTLELSSLLQNQTQEKELEINSTSSKVLYYDGASHPPVLVVSINLVSLPTPDFNPQQRPVSASSNILKNLSPSKSNTLLFPPSPNLARKKKSICGFSPEGGVLSVAILEGRHFEEAVSDNRQVYLKFWLGSESYRSKLVTWSSSPKWSELADLNITDLTDVPKLEIKLKDARSEELCKATLDISALTKEKTHEMEVVLDCRSLFLLLTITGTTPAAPMLRSSVREKETIPSVLEDIIGNLEVIVRNIEGVPKSSGASSIYCALELDNCRLLTNSVIRTGCLLSWDKLFKFEIKDIYSSLQLSVHDIEKNVLIGKVSIPLLNIKNGSKWFVLKDKNLRHFTRGMEPEIELEFSINYNVLKAALRTFTPKEEVYLTKSEKFKRRLFNDNLNRVKQLGAKAEEISKIMINSINWSCRWWVLRTYIIFILITYFFELWMVPMGVAFAIMVNFVSASDEAEGQQLTLTPSTSRESVSDEMLQEVHQETEHDMEEGDGNVSLNKIMTIVQDAFPMIQNCLGKIASFTEKIKNTFNCSVPFLSGLACLSLILISFLLMFFSLRTVIMVAGSVKFIKNLYCPGISSNNELLDFISRVPDDKMLTEARELQRSSNRFA